MAVLADTDDCIVGSREENLNVETGAFVLAVVDNEKEKPPPADANLAGSLPVLEVGWLSWNKRVGFRWDIGVFDDASIKCENKSGVMEKGIKNNKCYYMFEAKNK